MEGLYHQRLDDLISELTQKGVEIYEKNENSAEYIGTRITTKNIYDATVGISNIQIKLYKIEGAKGISDHMGRSCQEFRR